MFYIAFALYFVISIMVFLHLLTFKGRKKGDFTEHLMLVLLLVVAFLFMAMPVEYNYAVVIPFLFFFPIVISLSLVLKEGKNLFISLLIAGIISLLIAYLHTIDLIYSLGLTLLSMPIIVMTYFLGDNYTKNDFENILFSLLGLPIIVAFILSNRYLEYVLFDFIASFGFMIYLNRCDRVKKSFEEYVKAILSIPSNISSEIRRKLMHSVVLFVFLPLPLLYQLFEYGLKSINSATSFFMDLKITIVEGISPITLGAIILIGSILPIFIVLDILRLDFSISIVPEKLLRKHEINTFGGHVYITLGLLIVAMAFPERIFLASAAVAFISDTASAIIGRAFGRHKIVEGRSVEGTIAGIIAGILSAIPFVPLLPSVIVGIIIGITDIIIANKLNDNLVFPLVSALTLYIIL